MTAMIRSAASALKPRFLMPQSSALFLCDLQDVFRPLIHNSETVIRRSNFMYKVCKEMDIPCVITEQYPKALGHTVADFQHTEAAFHKKTFSMMTEEVSAHFTSLERTQVILCGIESHVCVLQTAMDLIDCGVEVHLVCDAVSSQRPHDRAIAMDRMKDMGVVMTTSESAVFQLMRTADHPQFRTVQRLLKEVNTMDNEFATQMTL